MEGTKEHYCWIKVYPVEGEAVDEGATGVAAPADKAATAPDPAGDERLDQMRAKLGEGQALGRPAPGPDAFSGRRDPPTATAGAGEFSGRRDPPAAPRPTFQGVGFHPASGPRPPPRVYGGSVLAGWWGIDEEYDGVRGSGSRVAMLPFIGTHEEAVAWIDSSDGRAWVAGSLTYFLQCFTVTGNF